MVSSLGSDFLDKMLFALQLSKNIQHFFAVRLLTHEFLSKPNQMKLEDFMPVSNIRVSATLSLKAFANPILTYLLHALRLNQ